jgi:hypothetical protein
MYKSNKLIYILFVGFLLSTTAQASSSSGSTTYDTEMNTTWGPLTYKGTLTRSPAYTFIGNGSLCTTKKMTDGYSVNCTSGIQAISTNRDGLVKKYNFSNYIYCISPEKSPSMYQGYKWREGDEAHFNNCQKVLFYEVP